MTLGPDQLLLAAAWFLAFLFSTTLHEAAHAFAAQRLGDPTAYHGGQVTLNPWPHIRREPVGMVVIPVLSFLLMGWMFGWASAPYDPRWADRYPRRAALMALAGPAANLCLVVAAGLLIRTGLGTGVFAPPPVLDYHSLVVASGGAAGGAATLLSVLFFLNLILFVFNLLPLPPLDGSAGIQLFMSDDVARTVQRIYRQPMIGWIGILIAWQFFDRVFGPVAAFSLRLLFPG
ncbi:MAG: site-2 protease family protein [Thermoanaerobaculia bacterium]|nr:site-2 protease family protein [Thermoanaerobaculia bacterium]